MKENQSKYLSHINENNEPTMVNVSDKVPSLRIAKARSTVVLGEEIISLMHEGDIRTKKGAVVQTAIIAGTMAAKKTGELIPLCHPLGLESCKFSIDVSKDSITIDCTCSINAKTGVEMEALTGVSIAALTIYDMCKAITHDIVIKDTRLIKKTGGKSDYTNE